MTSESEKASNPGPAVTRQGRRLERSHIDVSSDEEPLVRPNCGRHVVPRRCAEEEEVPSTIPATPVLLAQRGRQLFRSSDVDDGSEHVLARFGTLPRFGCHSQR